MCPLLALFIYFVAMRYARQRQHLKLLLQAAKAHA